MDTSKWLTIKEASSVSGVSQRTIERRIEKQLITTRTRQEPGKKPVIILPPDEVTALTSKHRPTLQVERKEMLPARPSRRQPDMAALLKALENLRVPIVQKLYLTKREAALYLGFSQAEVERLATIGTIPSFRTTNRQRMFARKDVESYIPPFRQLSEYRDGVVKEVALQ